MTPTLFGRYQTRVFLLFVLGIPITLFYGILYLDLVSPFALLGYVFITGFVWEPLYQGIQVLRWDRDWPPVISLIFGIVEGFLLFAMVKILPASLPGVDPGLTFLKFAFHYFSVWWAMFIFAQGPMRIIFPNWRFRGGQLF